MPELDIGALLVEESEKAEYSQGDDDFEAYDIAIEHAEANKLAEKEAKESGIESPKKSVQARLTDLASAVQKEDLQAAEKVMLKTADSVEYSLTHNDPHFEEDLKA